MSKFTRKNNNTVSVSAKLPSSAIALPILKMLEDVRSLLGELRLGSFPLKGSNPELYNMYEIALDRAQSINSAFGYYSDNADDGKRRYISVIKNTEPIVRVQNDDLVEGLIVSHGFLHQLTKSVISWWLKYGATQKKVESNYYFNRADFSRVLDIIFAVSESSCDIIESTVNKYTNKVMRLRNQRGGYRNDEKELPCCIIPKISSRYEKLSWFDLAYSKYKSCFSIEQWVGFQKDKDMFRRQPLTPKMIITELAEAMR